MILIKKENYVRSILIGGVGLGLEALLGLVSYSPCSSSQGGVS